MLAVIETHPVQYHAPVYRALEQGFGVPVTAIYASDFSVAGYRDDEFGAEFAWDTNLLSGYSSVFLSRVADGGARSAEGVSTHGLRRALQAVRPSAVMVVGYSPRFHRTAWYEAWRTGAPVLFRGETNDESDSRGWLKSALRRAALKLAYSRCSKLLYIGRRSAEHYRRLGCDGDRLVFAPYCVDTSPFQIDEEARERLRPDARRELGVPAGHTVLLFSGELTERQGVDLILPAVRLLPPEIRQRLTLVFLGDGDQRSALAASAEAEPRIPVVFLGFRNQCELSRYYHAADLLVLPSRRGETWGLVINEALHHGVPCVASDRVGCMPDLIESGVTGVVFRSGSASDLARAVRDAGALSDRADVRVMCRQTAAEYGVDRAAEGIALAYQGATRTQPSPMFQPARERT